MNIDIRFSSLPTTYWEKIVMRILKPDDNLTNIEALWLIDINLGKVDYNILHPILKNIYKNLSLNYDVIYINKKNSNIIKKEIPKNYNWVWIEKYKIKILRLINNYIPRINIINKKLKWKLITSNNFLYTSNDYYLITTCLYQFSPRNIKAFYNPIFIKIFKYFFIRRNLRKIILLSKTAYDEFILYWTKYLKLDKEFIKSKIDYIYPFLVNNNIVTENFIKERIIKSKKINFLFIARNFISKWGIELIEVLNNIFSTHKNKLNFELNIISDIPTKYLQKIQKLKDNWMNINIYWINYTQEELEKKFYLKSHVLLHLTRADLFWMVALESKKNWLAIITTNQYLNKELFNYDEACIAKINKKYIWNDWLPKLATESMWKICKNIIDIKQIENCIIRCIKDKQFLETLSINNLKSLNKITNNNTEKLLKIIK
jgi:hypothetical protein